MTRLVKETRRGRATPGGLWVSRSHGSRLRPVYLFTHLPLMAARMTDRPWSLHNSTVARSCGQKMRPRAAAQSIWARRTVLPGQTCGAVGKRLYEPGDATRILEHPVYRLFGVIHPLQTAGLPNACSPNWPYTAMSEPAQSPVYKHSHPSISNPCDTAYEGNKFGVVECTRLFANPGEEMTDCIIRCRYS